MTLAVSWVREVNGCQELLVASDSRLGGGMRWDQCPKIITLPRSDCFLCFAGDKDYAAPIMLQIYMAVQSYERLRTRAMDLHDFKGHLLNVINSLQKAIHYSSAGYDISETEFILGGYSWIRKAFSSWLIHFDKHDKIFKVRPSTRLIGKFNGVVIAGDWKYKAKNLIKELLQSRYGLQTEKFTGDGFDFEPFEILRDLLREAERDGTIGGAPQVVKVYQHMNCRPIAVYWPNKESGQVTVLGRHLLGYENTDSWILDPDTFISERRYVSQDKIQESAE